MEPGATEEMAQIAAAEAEVANAATPPTEQASPMTEETAAPAPEQQGNIDPPTDTPVADTTEPANDDIPEQPEEQKQEVVSSELAEKRTETKEKVEKAGSKVSTEGLRQIVEKVSKMTPEERQIWNTSDEFKNERRFYSVAELQSYTPENFPKNADGTVQEINLDATENPLIIYINGNKVTLTSIRNVTANNTYTCTTTTEVINPDGTKATNPDGSVKLQELDAPRQLIVEGQLIAEQDAIRETLPSHQRSTFDEYVRVLDAERQDKDPMAGTSEANLKEIKDNAEIATRPSEHYTREELPKKIAEHFEDDKNGKKIKKEVEDALERKAREKGVKVSELEKDDVLDVYGKIADKLFEPKLDDAGYRSEEPEAHLEQYEHGILGSWKLDFYNRNGVAPTREEIKQYARAIIYSRELRKDKAIISDPKAFAELVKRLSTKEKSFLALFLAGTLIWPFIEDFLPKAQ